MGRQKALDAIKIGDDALERRDFAAADDAYTEAVEAAPTLYTAAQRALTKRAEARRCGAKPGYKVDCTGTGYTPAPNDGLIAITVLFAYNVALFNYGLTY